MHELSLCESIADTALRHADDREVLRVYVTIGHLRQVVPETLRFCWDLVVAGSPLDGCELVVEAVPAAVSCADCAMSSTLTRPILECSSCGGTDVVLTSGDEFLVESIDLANADVDAKAR
jgi:hydrogenase nickel incorporation protein HypA/HybF